MRQDAIGTRVLLTGVLILVITINAAAQQPYSSKGLKDYYQQYFPIGVAVSANQLKDSAQTALILQEFNSLTPENAMKMGPIHPEEGRYNWRDADLIVNFAQQHHLKIRGHNLCWHNQTPKWFFYDGNGKLVSKTVLLQRLKDHIYQVVGRYKGKIYAWDVVNEAVADDDSQLLRNSLWYQICGEDFIAKAFQYAHEADPDAILFYNDYNTEQPQKRERIYRLLKQLLADGVPINAVGLQAHWSLNKPSTENLIATIKKYASLGLQVQITELDISVFTSNDERIPAAAAEQRQAEQYQRVFEVFREFKKELTGVTFWNLSDRSSWLNNFPVPGRKNYPLLFDQSLKPKAAYWKVTQF
ncbi:endo-1,4-beta-xylanase [Mucilaginibacter sp. dw_454]|uniref:endo-1,4-beta-xylanase n=1 Tax=Mucilaginibacter sp. dw_454 TaxID=2720079 RepID=UPI001BD684F5|nr:endo-1,4-beta-xylanase [Mucilaginibacter sp. dw_454]